MGKFYATLGISFLVLLLINIIWLIFNLILWSVDGLQILLQGMNFVERVYYSTLFKWIILADLIWFSFALVFAFSRKYYKTGDSYYLDYNPIADPKISVIIPTYNEEQNVEHVVNDYKKLKFVNEVFVIDNHSSDNTVEIAKKVGATVIVKPINKGFADSCILGFEKSLKSDSDIIVLTDCDRTFSAYDVNKMVPYLDNCDMVVGTRLIQVLLERGNQNGMFNTWGNFFIAKLIQLKYFSLLHMGVVSLTDVGCAHRCIRRESLEKMLVDIKNDYKKDFDKDGWLFLPYLNMRGIESGLKIVEIPITFKKRLGQSKSGAQKKSKGFKIGLRFIWFILKR